MLINKGEIMQFICDTCKGKIKHSYFKVYEEYFHDNEYCLYQTYSKEEYDKLYDEENEDFTNDNVYWTELEGGE